MCEVVLVVEEKGWLSVPCMEIISRFSGGFLDSLEFYRCLIAFLLLIFVGNSIRLSSYSNLLYIISVSYQLF